MLTASPSTPANALRELLACPFCGEVDGLTVGQTTAASLMWWSVECHGCRVSLAGDDTEAEAVAAWNTRTAPSPAPAKNADHIASASKLIGAPAAQGEVERLRAHIKRLQGAISWIDRPFTDGASAEELRQRIQFVRDDAARFALGEQQP